MKKFAAFCWVAAFVLGMVSGSVAADPPKKCKKQDQTPCQSSTDHGTPINGGSAKDPVFVVSPVVAVAAAIPKTVSTKEASEGSAAEAERLAKALEGTKDGAALLALAREAWRSEVNETLQRHAAAKARTAAKTTGERQELDFMLGALDQPEVAQAKLLEMGRGNGLEKKLAAERLGLLLANPNLKRKLP